MQSSVLIAYSTRGGSTAEVAQAIAAAIEDTGVTAEVLPVSQVKSLAGRDGVILGAPLYMGRFPKEFHQFLILHREALHAIRPSCFVLGPVGNRPKEFDSARTQAEKQLNRYPWLQPADVHIFGGRWSAEHLPFPFSLMLRIPGNPVAKIPAEDIRDWTAIREWALATARRIHPAASVVVE